MECWKGATTVPAPLSLRLNILGRTRVHSRTRKHEKTRRQSTHTHSLSLRVALPAAGLQIMARLFSISGAAAILSADPESGAADAIPDVGLACIHRTGVFQLALMAGITICVCGGWQLEKSGGRIALAECGAHSQSDLLFIYFCTAAILHQPVRTRSPSRQVQEAPQQFCISLYVRAVRPDKSRPAKKTNLNSRAPPSPTTACCCRRRRSSRGGENVRFHEPYQVLNTRHVYTGPTERQRIVTAVFKAAHPTRRFCATTCMYVLEYRTRALASSHFSVEKQSALLIIWPYHWDRC